MLSLMTAWQKMGGGGGRGAGGMASSMCLTLSSANKLKGLFSFHSVKGIGSFIHPGVNLQTFTLLPLIRARNHEKRYKSPKAKLRSGILGVKESRVNTRKLRAPGDLLDTKSCNILVASPKSEQGFPPVIQQRHKQLPKALRQTLSSAQQPGDSLFHCR